MRLILAGLLAALLLGAGGLLSASGQEGGTPPVPALWLPWEGGTVWRYVTGPHSWSGDGNEALDFQPPDARGRPCEQFTSAFWVTAAAAGRVISMPNAVEIDHGGGFRTGYYHLQDKAVKSGDWVEAGQRLGRPGCCPDGGFPLTCGATEPHLHFYTVRAGVRPGITGLTLGGWTVGDDGCLRRSPWETACPGGATLMSTAPRPLGSGREPLDVVLAVDASRSMRAPYRSAARLEAALAFLSVLGPSDNAGVVAFNRAPWVESRLAPLTGPRRQALERALRGLETAGPTDIAAGLEAACDELARRGRHERRAVVLITDGRQTAGELAPSAPCLEEHGWPLYVFSTEAAITPQLEAIASATGGALHGIAGGHYVLCDAEASLKRAAGAAGGEDGGECSVYRLAPGEVLQAPVDVPPEQQQAAVSVELLSPQGAGTLPSVSLLTPSGAPVATGENVRIEAGGGRLTVSIAAPEPGRWTVVVSAKGLGAEAVIRILYGTVGLPPQPAPAAGEASPTPTETPSPSPSPTESPTPDAEGEETPAPGDPEATPAATPAPEPSPSPWPKTTPAPPDPETPAAATPAE